MYENGPSAPILACRAGKRVIVVPRMNRGKLPVALVSLLALPGPAMALDLGARALATGQTGMANPVDIGGAPSTLATISLTEQYQILAGAGLGPDGRFLLRGSAADTRTSAVSLAAGYYRLTDDVPPAGDDLPGWQPADEELHDQTQHQGVALGVAYPFLDRRMSASINARYDWRSSELHGKQAAFNMGVSYAARPFDALTLSVAAFDLLENEYRDTTRTLSLAGRYDFGPYLGIEVASMAPLTKDWSWAVMEWHAGASVGLVQFLRLNGGYFNDSGVNFATGGITLTSERADVDYGMKVQLDQPGRNFHELDVRVKF